MKYANTKEDQAKLENTAAVNLLCSMIDLLNEKKESIRNIERKYSDPDADYQVIKVGLSFECEFLSQNIDSLRKQIENQQFNY